MDPAQTTTILPESFLTYHLRIAFPEFVKTRPKHVLEVLENFNIFGLLANLFAPYKRMTLSGKRSLGDKISFNIISSVVGAMARSGFIAAGLLLTLFFVFFDLVTIPLYLIFPILSYSKFQKIQNTYVFEKDLKSEKALLLKIQNLEFASLLFAFFDQDFKNLFSKIPNPTTLNLKAGQTIDIAFETILENWQEMKNYLSKNNIKSEDFKLLTKYLHQLVTTSEKVRPQPLGQMLIYGYTNTVDRFGKELTNKHYPPFFGKEEILRNIEKILNRPENNNVVLVGEPGVGKHTTLDALASAIEKGELESLKDKRLILLDIVALLGASKNPAEIQASFEMLLEESKKAGNIILAIDDIDRITTSDAGRMDLSGVVSAILTDNTLPLVGLTTIDNYNAYIRTNAQTNSLFERIDVEEPTRDQLITILVEKAVTFAKTEKITSSYASLLEIIDQSTRLLPDKKQPEKSILILEDTLSEAKRKKLSQLDLATVDEVISIKTKTPVGKITQIEAEKLTELEAILHKRIVGQEEAIEHIAKAMRRARAELEKTTKPMGSFLFLGPTGVGKTETAKALAEAYFGDENKMVRLDMTEFQGQDAATRLIGNPVTKSQGQLTTQIRENPFGILLVDEFEKASHDVQNLFLQILDEGHLTDAFGKRVNFNNIIVIATSNAAAEFIREEVEKSSQSQTNGSQLSSKLVDYVLSKGLFSPELINRFDATIVYKPLNHDEVVQVAYLMLSKLARHIKESKNVTLEITPDLAQEVAKEGFVVAFGARPIKRLIQNKIEDEIAKQIISKKLTNGSVVYSQDLLNLFR